MQRSSAKNYLISKAAYLPNSSKEFPSWDFIFLSNKNYAFR